MKQKKTHWGNESSQDTQSYIILLSRKEASSNNAVIKTVISFDLDYRHLKCNELRGKNTNLQTLTHYYKIQFNFKSL